MHEIEAEVLCRNQDHVLSQVNASPSCSNLYISIFMCVGTFGLLRCFVERFPRRADSGRGHSAIKDPFTHAIFLVQHLGCSGCSFKSPVQTREDFSAICRHEITVVSNMSLDANVWNFSEKLPGKLL